MALPAYAFHFYASPTENLPLVRVPEVMVSQTPMPCVSAEDQKEQQLSYCPDVSSLVLQGTTWSAPGHWRSYQVSFMTQVTRFLGAQWTGTNVGRVVCLYAGDNPNDFPVQLVFPSLARVPGRPVWQLSDDGASANCLSHQSQVCDCPISVFETEPSVDSARAAVMGIQGYSVVQDGS